MPEQLGLQWSTPESKKNAPIIKMSCGIGDTDGFPAFDVDSEAYASKDDTKWGFLVTGGAEFHMPLTVFQVTPDGLADKAGIRLGDIILQINEEDATQLTLNQAHEKINASPKKIHFLLRNMEEDDPMGQFEAGEEKSIVMRVPKPMPPPRRIVASSIEMRLLEMQRKLSAIARIPKILSSTLATVSQSFGRMSEEEAQAQAAAYIQRKCSYDEDALDYELRDGGDDDEDLMGDTDTDTDRDTDTEGVDSDEDDLVQVKAKALSQDGVKQSKLLKDVTPESDYASEANYPTNEGSDADASDDSETEDAAGSAVFFMKLPAASVEDATSYPSSDEDDDDDDEDSDFLSTTYTWNIRNVPKLRINDEAEAEVEAETDTELRQQQKEEPEEELKSVADIPKVRPATPTPQAPSQESAGGQTQKLLFKLDKLERSWPWADRERIIYKQSTCHLVPRKPLGLVGQRMQLLLKAKKQ
ncbi:nucleolin isoform X2 [Drosophila subobscura]|uniref:nucleolin isoform X2 n=1 Tax=Drosophila subobscura TaxID=7241 RepID=UPI00155AB959|nr:nucleolin isoform X2 [Drosophila subobscura]